MESHRRVVLRPEHRSAGSSPDGVLLLLVPCAWLRQQALFLLSPQPSSVGRAGSAVPMRSVASRDTGLPRCQMLLDFSTPHCQWFAHPALPGILCSVARWPA